MSQSKAQRYQELVAKFKSHKFSDPGLLNPHHIEGFKHEVINPWELWHNNLNAKIMFIGQDFSDSASLVANLKTNWVKEKNSPTNKNLITLFTVLGYPIDDVDYTGLNKYPLFFTNAILGIKQSEKQDMSKAIKDSWWRETADEYLKELIDIVQPKHIIAMSMVAYKAVCHINGIKPKAKILEAIGAPIKLPDGKNLFVVQHCSPNGQRSRKQIDQIHDWMDIKNVIEP